MNNDGLKKNDPYRNMDSAQDDIRPDFLGGSNGAGNSFEVDGGGKTNTAGSQFEVKGNGRRNRGDKNNAAADSLKNAEDAATKNENKKPEDSLAGTKGAEESGGGGLYSGGGKNIIKGKGGKGRFIGKGLLRISPMVAIFGLIIAASMLFVGAQTLMPVAISEMLIEKFNSVGVSSTVMSDAWLDAQLNEGVRKENLKTGDTEKLFAFSPFQVQELKKQKIIVLENVGGAPAVLLYPKGETYVPVVGTEYIGRVSIGDIQSASNLINISSPITAEEALKDYEFKTPYSLGSKTWRGGGSGWFDDTMGSITSAKLGIQRNRWLRFVARGVNKVTDKFNKIAAGTKLNMQSDFNTRADNDEPEKIKDKDGKEIDRPKKESTQKVEVEGGNEFDVNDDTVPKINDEAEVGNQLTKKGLKAAAAVANISNIADTTCQLMEAMMAIYGLAYAYQSLQFLNLISGYLEAVDKMKAGDGNGSPIHEYELNLVKKIDNISAMESAGMNWLFSNDVKIDNEDQSVQNVNIEKAMTNASSGVMFSGFRMLANGVKELEKCGWIRMGAATANLVVTVASFVPVVGAGVKASQIAWQAVKGALKKVVVGATVLAALNVIIPLVTKKIVKFMTKNMATEWFGEDLGNAMIAAANKYLGGNGTSGGQGPGDLEILSGYLDVRDAVIADEARVQRSIRSPFDVTSQYTFLGSLAYSVIPLAFSGGGIMSSIKNISSLTSNSIVALSPTASAIDKKSMLRSKGDCPLLEAAGIVGDAYCNPYIITDTSTIKTSSVSSINGQGGQNIHPQSIIKQIQSMDGLDDKLNVISGSNNAKYSVFCGQRTSQYMIKDAAITTRVLGGGSTSKIAGLVNLVVPELAEIPDALKQVKNNHWISGQACVASNNPSVNEYWPENKIYQRGDEIFRELENMNPGYKSPYTVAIEEDRKQNPLDDSYEGKLARFSGMTKEQVEDTLALVEYYQFVDEYEPSSRFAFGAPVFDHPQEIKFDNDNKLANNYFLLLNQISFADIRNRNFVV